MNDSAPRCASKKKGEERSHNPTSFPPTKSDQEEESLQLLSLEAGTLNSQQLDRACEIGVAYCCAAGRDDSKSLRRAAQLFHRGAIQKHADSMYNLANCCFHGFGVAKDRQYAVDLSQQASDFGHVDALLVLARIYCRANAPAFLGTLIVVRRLILSGSGAG